MASEDVLTKSEEIRPPSDRPESARTSIASTRSASRAAAPGKVSKRSPVESVGSGRSSAEHSDSGSVVDGSFSGSKLDSQDVLAEPEEAGGVEEEEHGSAASSSRSLRVSST